MVTHFSGVVGFRPTTSAVTRSVSFDYVSGFNEEVPLSRRIKEAVRKKYESEGDVSRILACWDNFVEGQKLHRYLDDQEEILQTADCFIDGLEAKCFHKVQSFPWAQGLERHTDTILRELKAYEARRRSSSQKAKIDSALFLQTLEPTGDGKEGDGSWIGPRDASGSDYGPQWKTLALQDRSVWDADMQIEFPQTVAVLKTLQVPSCEVFFAKQGPKSGLKPHSDKNNFIMTCHLGLDVPPKEEGKECFITVGNENYTWKNGETCVFDTSIFHSTENKSDMVRYVLLIRFWHPDMSSLEVEAMQYIFSYLDAAALGNDALEIFEMRELFMGKDQHSGLQQVAKESVRKDNRESRRYKDKQKKKEKSGGGSSGGFG